MIKFKMNVENAMTTKEICSLLSFVRKGTPFSNAAYFAK